MFHDPVPCSGSTQGSPAAFLLALEKDGKPDSNPSPCALQGSLRSRFKSVKQRQASLHTLLLYCRKFTTSGAQACCAAVQ
jgi:hypothetical protein